MLGLLPGGDTTTFFADVAVLRHSGMLSLFSGSKPVQDPEYRTFVRETSFDYTRDLDAVAGAVQNGQVFFIIRGRFDWNKLRQYARSHSGSCGDDICRVATSTPGRWASFVTIQPNVLALALSQDSSAALRLKPNAPPTPKPMPPQPIWVRISTQLLRNPVDLPAALRIFAISLQSANPVILSVQAAHQKDAAFDLHLDALAPNEATAEVTRNQLEIQTKMLKLELARERQQPSPADLTGLLTSGTFQIVDKHVIGTWPVRKELLSALQ